MITYSRDQNLKNILDKKGNHISRHNDIDKSDIKGYFATDFYDLRPLSSDEGFICLF